MGVFRSSLFSSAPKRGVFARFWPWFLLVFVLLALMGGGIWFAQNRLQNLAQLQPSSSEMVNPNVPQASAIQGNPVVAQPRSAVNEQTDNQVPAKNTLSKPEEARIAVKQTLSNWASAWSALDAGGYLSFYGADFEPPEGLSRNEWEQQRQARIVNKNHIDVTLDNLSIETDAQGTTAIARFTQHYRSDSFKETTQKTMVLVPQNGQWKIVAERVD